MWHPCWFNSHLPDEHGLPVASWTSLLMLFLMPTIRTTIWISFFVHTQTGFWRVESCCFLTQWGCFLEIQVLCHEVLHVVELGMLCSRLHIFISDGTGRSQMWHTCDMDKKFCMPWWCWRRCCKDAWRCHCQTRGETQCTVHRNNYWTYWHISDPQLKRSVCLLQ